MSVLSQWPANAIVAMMADGFSDIFIQRALKNNISYVDKLEIHGSITFGHCTPAVFLFL